MTTCSNGTFFFEEDGCDALVAGGVDRAVEFDGHFELFSASFGRMKLELSQMSFCWMISIQFS